MSGYTLTLRFPQKMYSWMGSSQLRVWSGRDPLTQSFASITMDDREIQQQWTWWQGFRHVTQGKADYSLIIDWLSSITVRMHVTLGHKKCQPPSVEVIPTEHAEVRERWLSLPFESCEAELMMSIGIYGHFTIINSLSVLQLHKLHCHTDIVWAV